MQLMIFKRLFLFILLFAVIKGFSQTDSLKEVVVKGYSGTMSTMLFPGATQVVDTEDFNKTDPANYSRMIAIKAGAVLEERANGSYRIAIRGSSLRSPFGVRNVKVYWNNIQLTEPFGSTPLNILDPAVMEQVQIIKGPSASSFGAGLGGAVFISTKPKNSDQASVLFEGGSFNRFRNVVRANYNSESNPQQTIVSYNSLGGFRDHTQMERLNLLHNGTFRLKRGELNLRFFYANLFYELPGGLTREQMMQDPSAARLGNAFALGSEESNASIHTHFADMAMSSVTDLTDQWQLNTSAYLRGYRNENPFNLDYKKRLYQEIGGRYWSSFSSSGWQMPFYNETGMEFQAGVLGEQNFGNNFGEPDTLNFSDEVLGTQLMAFSNSQWELFPFLRLSFGLSYSFFQYDMNRMYNAVSGDLGRVKADFPGILSPRLGLVGTMQDWSAYFSVSQGFNPPTLSEVRTNDGEINTGLEEEKGTNFEIGLRHQDERHQGEVSLFYFETTNGITSFAENDREKFRNTGEIAHFGIESAHTITLIKQSGLELELQQSNWYYQFEFLDYVTTEGDFSGNALTGVSPWYNYSGLGLFLRDFSIHGGYLFYSQAPLDDAGTVESEPVHDVTFRINYNWKIGDKWGLRFYGGFNNLLDRNFSFGNDVNAPGNRYFQPAPPRNWYAGIEVRL